MSAAPRPTRRRPVRHPALLALTAALALAAPAAAQDRGVAVGARAATTGFGAEVAVPLAAVIGLRAAVTGGSFDLEFESERVTYEGDLELASALVVADLHPFGGAFRLSAGALVHDHALEGRAPVLDLLLEEGLPVPTDLELGELRARATVEPVAPYAGIGFGGRRRARGLGVSLDLGAAWHGEPEVEVDYAGPLGPILGQAVIDRFLEEERRELEEELRDYTVYPVVALSLSYRF